MPVPASMRPKGPATTIYGRFAFGDLADICLLDTRQYRSHHACLTGPGASMVADCPQRHLPTRSLLGTAQETWFGEQMRGSAAQWSIVAQPTLVAEADRKPGAEHGYWMDGWDGYTESKKRLFDALAAQRNHNALVIGGDVHAFWAADLRRNVAEPRSAVVATEFVGGSITSQGSAETAIANLRAKNPHLRFGRGDKRGYGVMTLERKACSVEFRAVDDEKDASSAVRTLARFAVENGRPGVEQQSP